MWGVRTKILGGPISIRPYIFFFSFFGREMCLRFLVTFPNFFSIRAREHGEIQKFKSMVVRSPHNETLTIKRWTRCGKTQRQR